MIIKSLVAVEYVKTKMPFWRTLYFQMSVLFIFTLIAPIAVLIFQPNVPLAEAETGTLTGQTIDGDFGVNNFAANSGASDTSCAGGTHCDYVDEDGETDWLGTGTGMDGTTAEEEFTTTNPSIPGSLLSVDAVRVIVRANINGACQGSGGSNCDSLAIRIFIGGAYHGTTYNTAALSGTQTDYSSTTTWGSISAATADDLRIEIIRTANGGGSGSAKDDDVRIYDVRYEMDYSYLVARPMITQEGFVWENDDYNTESTVQSGSEFSSAVAMDNVRQGERLNLRMQLKNSGEGGLSANEELALFYDKGDGFWSRVQNTAAFTELPSGSEDCEGFGDISGGSTNLYCTTVIDGDHNSDFNDNNSINFSPAGVPHIVAIDNTEVTGTTSGFNVIFISYVGSGGNCVDFTDTGSVGSDKWQCEIVLDGISGSDFAVYASMTFTPEGVPYILATTAAQQLIVAHRVGSGGNCDGFIDATGGSDAWQCEIIASDNDPLDYRAPSKIISGPTGTMYVLTENTDEATGGNTGDNLVLATRVGSGGNCTSSAWSCEVILDGDNSTITADNWDMVLAADGAKPILVGELTNRATGTSTGTNLITATFVGSGGNCDGYIDTSGGSDAWQCDIVVDTVTGGSIYTSAASSPNGTPYIILVAQSINSGGTLGSNLILATYVGSGGNCDGFIDPTGGSDAWQCETILDGDSGDFISTFHSPNMAFSPVGVPHIVVSHNSEDTGGAIGNNLILATFVGSGGNCDGFADTSGGSDAWQCETVLDGGGTNDFLKYEIAIGFDGNPIITATDHSEPTGTTQGGNLIVIEMKRKAEIGLAMSEYHANGSSLASSKSDMTSASDTANRDDTDCLTASSWNNGIYFGAEIGTGVSLPAGDVTSQCTEIMWTIDTSQAIPGATYRFVVATKDSLDPSVSVWRGPIQIDEYPTITIAEDFEQSTRYSKSLLSSWTGCDTYATGSVGSADWGCAVVDDQTSTTIAQGISTAFNPVTGVPYIGYKGVSNSIIVAHYVGSGGNCDSYGTGSTGSDAWQCTVVDDQTDAMTDDVSLDISLSGIPYVVYNTTTADSIIVAHYVGSGGNCDTYAAGSAGSDAWQCTIVDDQTDTIAGNLSLDISPTGIPYVSYENFTDSSLIVAHYVGSGGNCDTYAAGSAGSDAWQCTIVDDQTDGVAGNDTSLSIAPSGIPYVSYQSSSALLLAHYVGSGGNCDTYAAGSAGSDAWQCMVIDEQTDDIGREPSLFINSEDEMYIAHNGLTKSAVYFAHYVGSGGNCDTYATGSAGSDAWQCTIVDDQTDTVGVSTSLVIGPGGTPYIAYRNTSDGSLQIAKYVGSGGNCDTYATGSAGSDAWQCTIVDDQTDSLAPYIHLSISANGVPYIAYQNTSDSSLIVASLILPEGPLGTQRFGRNIPNGDYQYYLASGKAPYNQTGVNCTGNPLLAGYCGLDSENGDYDSLTASNAFEQPVYGLATKFGTNSTVPAINWVGNTNLAPSTSGADGDIVVEMYRFGTTNAWEEVARNSTSSDCSTNNCLVKGTASGTPSEYFEIIDGQYWAYVRVYQIIDGTTTIDFKVDMFKATQLTSQLSSGGFFRDGAELPLNLQR